MCEENPDIKLHFVMYLKMGNHALYPQSKHNLHQCGIRINHMRRGRYSIAPKEQRLLTLKKMSLFYGLKLMKISFYVGSSLGIVADLV